MENSILQEPEMNVGTEDTAPAISYIARSPNSRRKPKPRSRQQARGDEDERVSQYREDDAFRVKHDPQQRQRQEPSAETTQSNQISGNARTSDYEPLDQRKIPVLDEPELNVDTDVTEPAISYIAGSRKNRKTQSRQQQRGSEKQTVPTVREDDAFGGTVSAGRINREPQQRQQQELSVETAQDNRILGPSLIDQRKTPSEDEWATKMEQIQKQYEAALKNLELSDDDEMRFELQEIAAELMRMEREKNAERKRRDMLAKSKLEIDGSPRFADHWETDKKKRGGDSVGRDDRRKETNFTPSNCPSPTRQSCTPEANIARNSPLPLETNVKGLDKPISLPSDERATNGSGSRKKRVLLAATGSVASIKIPILVRMLQAKNDVEVRVVATERASHFFNEQEIEAPLFSDKHEWEAWKKMSDPVLHIDLRTWADLIVIAPLDANTLAKLACGLCDNLITCILRAWNVAKPVIVCPAMNTAMWTHPHTAAHLNLVSNFLGYKVIQPISKTLACGDTGIGAMAEPDWIVTVVRGRLFDMASA